MFFGIRLSIGTVGEQADNLLNESVPPQRGPLVRLTGPAGVRQGAWLAI